MVKNKDLPDSAAHPQSGHSLSLSLCVCLCLCLSLSVYLSLSLPCRLGPIKPGLMCLLLPTQFILRVPPGSCRGWTSAGKGTFENYMEPQKQRVAPKKSWEETTRHYHMMQQLCFWSYESVRVWKSYVWHFETPWTIACQAPLSLGFLRQYCSGLPFLSPGDLCNS